MVSVREAKRELKKKQMEFAKHPTMDNAVAMLEARYIVVLVVAIYLIAALLPSAITSLNQANTTGWTSTQIAIYAVLSIVILAAIIVKITE